MPFWLWISLAATLFPFGGVVGIFLQRYHMPQMVFRKLRSRLMNNINRKSTANNNKIQLEVRTFEHAYSPKIYYTEEDGQYTKHTLDVGLSEIALILIDVWSSHPNKGWMQRAQQNIRCRLLPLVEGLRQHKVPIVHCPHDQPINQLVKPLPQELLVDGPKEVGRLIESLQGWGTRYLLYAGYASNMCILNRPVGIQAMSKLGYDIIFVRDASLALEAPQFLSEETAHSVATNMIETDWGMSTEVHQVLSALEHIK